MFDYASLDLGALDALSYKKTWIHRLDPRTKVLSALAFVVTVVSFPKYALAGLVPFFVFPAIVCPLAEIPIKIIARRVLAASVFAVFVGLFNPLLERQDMLRVLGCPISGGWVSFGSILIKYILTMSAVLLLISTTSFPGICRALAKLGVPAIFVGQLQFLYRYLFVLMEETLRMIRARELRCFGRQELRMKLFIPFVGTLFMRALERSERVYQAMLSRGFTGAMGVNNLGRWRWKDFASLILILAALIFLRSVEVVHLLGQHIQGLISGIS